MIVCVLLVSNSRGCCLAAGRSLGLRLRDRPVRRDNTLGSLTPTIHTQSCLIPIITRCHHFIHTNQYSGHIKKFKVWIESNRSLRCHVTTLSWRQVSQSPPPPVTKMRVPGLLFFLLLFLFVCLFFLFFFGGGGGWRLGVWNRTAPDRSHLIHVATTKLMMRCVYKLNFICTLSFPMKMTSSTQLWYIRASAGRYVFRWARMLDEGLAFVQAGVPSCPDDAPLRSYTREFQMWRRRCKQIDPHWFQGYQIRFWWMLSTISWK